MRHLVPIAATPATMPTTRTCEAKWRKAPSKRAKKESILTAAELVSLFAYAEFGESDGEAVLRIKRSLRSSLNDVRQLCLDYSSFGERKRTPAGLQELIDFEHRLMAGMRHVKAMLVLLEDNKHVLNRLLRKRITSARQRIKRHFVHQWKSRGPLHPMPDSSLFGGPSQREASGLGNASGPTFETHPRTAAAPTWGELPFEPPTAASAYRAWVEMGSQRPQELEEDATGHESEDIAQFAPTQATPNRCTFLGPEYLGMADFLRRPPGPVYC